MMQTNDSTKTPGVYSAFLPAKFVAALLGVSCRRVEQHCELEWSVRGLARKSAGRWWIDPEVDPRLQGHASEEATAPAADPVAGVLAQYLTFALGWGRAAQIVRDAVKLAQLKPDPTADRLVDFLSIAHGENRAERILLNVAALIGAEVEADKS